MLRIAKSRVLSACIAAIAVGVVPIKAQPSIVLTAAQPAVVLAGGSSASVTLSGSGFAAGMSVRVGSQTRAATVNSSTSLKFTLTVDDLATAGDAELRVAAIDGRTSDSVTLRINNPIPALTIGVPLVARVGSEAQTFDLLGSGFTRQSVILWNGQARTTTFRLHPAGIVTAVRLEILPSDLVKPGFAQISVRNPAPGGGDSEPAFLHIPQRPAAGAVDLAWDGISKRLVISDGIGLRTLDPQTGALSDRMEIGQGAGRMVATDDGSKLFVALDGELALGRVSLPGLQLEAKYPIGPIANLATTIGGIEDLAVVPSRNDMIAASIRYTNRNPRHIGVALFDSNGRRPTMTGSDPSKNVIAFGSDASVLYGYDTEGLSRSAFSSMKIGPTGISLERILSNSDTGPIGTFLSGFTTFQDKVFTANGRVYDLDTMTPRAQFPEGGSVAVNRRTGLAYSFPRDLSKFNSVGVYRGDTLEHLGQSPRFGLFPRASRFLTWGEDGLAFINDGDVFLMPHFPLSPGLKPLTSTSLVNGASFTSTWISPGLIATLFGTDLGPTELVVAQPEQNRFPTTLAGVTVTFNGLPAPLIYVRNDQVALVVPYALAPGTTVQMQIQYNGRFSPPVDFQLGASGPAIFTLPSVGTGQGAILNQNNSVNSASNPADRGSVIQVFMTGAGQTNPPSPDGQLMTGALPTLVLPVTAYIGDLPAVVEYAGPAPGAIAGLTQVNLRVPGVPPGPSVPVWISVGDDATRANVTVAIR